jgi:hypothetical protein
MLNPNVCIAIKAAVMKTEMRTPHADPSHRDRGR